jgi:hypothetical protein
MPFRVVRVGHSAAAFQCSAAVAVAVIFVGTSASRLDSDPAPADLSGV